MTKIVFATTNEGKLKEVNRLLNLKNISLQSLQSIKNNNIETAEENGRTFKENAMIKARHYYKFLNCPVIADDSGLIVPAINNEPGVYSARYAGPNATDQQNISHLLKKMDNISTHDRSAFFVSEIVYKDENLELYFSGKCEGRILNKPLGNFGFGYDPVFFFEKKKKTFAQLSIAEKNIVSHRGKAIQKLKEFLKTIA